MKQIAILLTLMLTLAGCSDWSDHYDEASISSDELSNGDAKMSAYDGDIVSYMKGTGDVSEFSKLLEEAGIYDNTTSDGQYTFVVTTNEMLSAATNIADRTRLAKGSVCNMAVDPSMLKEGFGLLTRAGNNIWVYGEQPDVKLDDYDITKIVRTTNGYVYYISGVLTVRQSVYEYLQSLGDNYSRFKKLVSDTEEEYFDREHSQPLSVNNEGMVVYDSVKVKRNELMDRYDREGIATWNMRDESFVTTMFIPTNQQIDDAVQTAIDSLKQWKAMTDLNGNTLKTLDSDTEERYRKKFENWIVRACFVSRRVSEDELTPTSPDITCVGDYQQIINEVEDITYYSNTNVEAALWRPSVQTIDTSSKVTLSNGFAYYCTNLKIPNHIVIYRLKSKFYQLWDAFGGDESEQNKYFRWNNWEKPLIVENAQSEFTLSESLPTMYYHVLTAEPVDTAMRDSLPCSVEYDGLLYISDGKQYVECNVPAGEYYLRMGFKHSLQYSLSIIFEDSLIVKDMIMYAQGSNFHFDRGAAAPLPHYGEQGIGYRENFDPDYWMLKDQKAIAYDTDGYTVGIVNLKHSGNFRIKIESSDMSSIYVADAARNKNNVKQLMMYHWCLRPTKNNY